MADDQTNIETDIQTDTPTSAAQDDTADNEAVTDSERSAAAAGADSSVFSIEELTTSTADAGEGLLVARHAGIHLLFWVAAAGLFAAADSWSVVTGLGLATFLGVITGAIFGIATAILLHEWAHFLGARVVGACYTIPAKTGLFVYDWDFEQNSVSQFYKMSIAGSLGGLLAVLWLWNGLPADTIVRAAVHGGVVAAFIYAALIEWPVLSRTSRSGDPMGELAKTDQTVLLRSLVIAIALGVIWAWLRL